MPTPFRSYLARDALLAAANAAINAACTWYLWRHDKPLRLLGPDVVVADLATTPMVIALLSALLGTATARRKLGDGGSPSARARALRGPCTGCPAAWSPDPWP